jgi:hypothetical protein
MRLSPHCGADLWQSDRQGAARFVSAMATIDSLGGLYATIVLTPLVMDGALCRPSPFAGVAITAGSMA